ncbi:MAG TPA: hypothetical protein VHL58_07050 [Thermoanaerobaculia bacterium]|nr:hypothetical protein [Thermoanaerobaculia bacterium]
MSNNVKRALRTALIVGPILALINQTPLLWRLAHGQSIPLLGLLRIALTFTVPFLVSLFSATMADRSRSRL